MHVNKAARDKDNKMDNKIKHLEMLESIIERMGNNSFQLKGWTVALVSIIGALSANDAEKKFLILAIIPLISFWLIDSYYLHLERKYKMLYEFVRTKNEKDIDFNMNVHEINGKKIGYFSCIISGTELPFYGSIIAAVFFLVHVLKVL